MEMTVIAVVLAYIPNPTRHAFVTGSVIMAHAIQSESKFGLTSVMKTGLMWPNPEKWFPNTEQLSVCNIRLLNPSPTKFLRAF